MKRVILVGGVLVMGVGCSDREKDRAEVEAMRAELAEMREMLLARQEAEVRREVPVMPAAGVPGAPGASGIPGVGAPGMPPGVGALGAGGPPSGVGAPEGVGVDFSKLPGGLSEGDWRLERAREEVEYWDRDGDGKLSQEEYLAKYVERHERRFEGLDVDGDGVLTAEEVGEVAPPPGAAANSE
ncbi:MAG: hypothetical protein AAF591_04840 [Verrucomicrobiota bacterium]